MKMKLFDSELKVMEILWKEGDLSAGQLAKVLKERIGWNRNTTYTVIKKCVEKGAIAVSYTHLVRMQLTILPIRECVTLPA